MLVTGLDEAILGFGAEASGGDGDPENNAKRVAALLEHGAHGLLSAGAQEGVEQASAAFQNADIDQVRVYIWVCVGVYECLGMNMLSSAFIFLGCNCPLLSKV